MAKSNKPDEPKAPTPLDQSADGTDIDRPEPVDPDLSPEGDRSGPDGSEGTVGPVAADGTGRRDETDEDRDDDDGWDEVDHDPDESYDDDRDVYDDDDDDEDTPRYRAAETAHEPTPEYDDPPGRQSIWPAILGGAIAAVLGFVLGRAELLDNYLPSGLRRTAVDVAPIRSELERLNGTVDAQAERIDALAAEAGAAAGDEGLDAMKATMTDLQASLEDLTARITTLEQRPVAMEQDLDGQSETLASLQQSLDSQREALEAQRREFEQIKSDLETAEADAASEAQRLLARAALTRVLTAVDTGESFEPALVDLKDSGAIDVPPALTALAPQGVPTMGYLREAFPDAARAALAAARSDPDSEKGFTGFLKRQLGARSVSPREGDDADAVLSRAEALLKAGNLSGAMNEIDTLPPSARDAMSGWISDAQTRADALTATQSLSQNLSN
ncbi:mitofilin family membrane protein [Sulfitobacter sp. LCG007]